MINENLLLEIEGRANSAVEGPWVFSSSLDGRRGSVVAPDSKVICSYGPEDLGYSGTKHANFQFMANARNDVPFLVNVVRAQAEEIDKLKKALHKIAYETVCNNKSWEDDFRELTNVAQMAIKE